ncbi:bifunctional ribonuclease/(p)ppGpp synthase [Nocardioides marinquilinus]|uniref:Bifunctional ribonuclease/(P)ppGpp synthase n=1 Tax=Nocardioides marinquilinus TaxID=1210400 RepID=A0ABP9Q4J2_9ACTN
MHFVGVDLAWGQRNPTGLAVLDDDARLLHVSAVRTDDEIVETLTPYVEGDCVVGIDAPLVVVNPTGQREAERLLNADFQRFHAGAHPSNTGKPEFADGTRGGAVAKRLGLDVDPRSGRRRRALEVYPHPATIVLFGLQTVLRYKAKPGRDLESLRGELLTLMGHLESVVEVSDQWRTLRSLVETATQKAQLRRVEDQVDAVMCAVVARFVHTRPDDVTTYGDLATGYIVTPTLGVEPVSQPRDPVARYRERHPGLVVAGERAVAGVQEMLDEAGIDYLSVTGRTKTVASFAEKAARTDDDGHRLYDDPLTQITDQVGVRVITYVRDDVTAVAELLADQAQVTDDRDMGQETASQGRFGYASRHLLVVLDDAPGSLAVQVQVRTVLQHAWAEFEHDIRYKGTVPAEHAPDFDRRFTLAAGLLELADREFSEVRERLRGASVASVAADPAPGGLDGIGPRELAAFLAGQYSDAGWSRTDRYEWIVALLAELGVTSLVQLAETLRGADESVIAERMDYRRPPGAVRRLDDALLWVHGERYVGLDANVHRRDLLAQRLERMRG